MTIYVAHVKLNENKTKTYKFYKMIKTMAEGAGERSMIS